MADVRQELEAVCREAGAALDRGASAAEFASLFYDEDVVVVGEGWPVAVRGLAALVPELVVLIESWGSGPRLKFTLVDPVMADNGVATTFVAVEVGGTGERYRVLYAWKRTPRGWRVVLEMFGAGLF